MKFCLKKLFKVQGNSKSLRYFRPLRYSSRDGHAEGEHVNRGRDTSSFCPTLQVLGMSTLGEAADINPVMKFQQHTLQHLAADSSDCLTILRRSCVKSRGIGARTRFLMYPHKKKSQGVRSGDLAGQGRRKESLTAARPIQRPGRLALS